MVKIYQQPFAHAGAKQIIPDDSDPQGFVSNADGFTTDYELPDTDPNYKPIERAEFNGLMNMVTESLGEIQQFGFAKWQAITWPQGARVVEGDVVYRALVQTSQQPPHADWIVDQPDINSILQPSMTGSASLYGTTDNTVRLTDIVTTLGLEVGDVIRIQYSDKLHTVESITYDKLHTVESITNDGSIIVNYEHAGNRGDGSLRLPDFTGQATVTRIAKWYNAPLGLGQAWVDVTSSRALATTYTNTAGRSLGVSAHSNTINSVAISTLTIDGLVVYSQQIDTNSVFNSRCVVGVIPPGATYSVEQNRGGLSKWSELR